MESISNRDIVNRASIAGAIFGAISGSYVLISQFIANLGKLAFISSLLALAKFGVCIWLMGFLMKKLCMDYDGVSRRDTFKFGRLTALFSALITALVSYVTLQFIFPDAIAQAMDLVFSMYGSLLDSNSMEMLEKIEGSYAEISLVSTFLWCWLYGVILSAIWSHYVPKPDPFADFRNEDKDEDDE